MRITYKTFLASTFIVFAIVTGCELDTKAQSKEQVLIKERIDNEHCSLEKKRFQLFTKYKDSKSFNLVHTVKDGAYILEIETQYSNDTLPYDFVLDSLMCNPIVLQQKLVFRQNDSILKSFLIPVKKLKVKNINGKQLEIPEVSIYKIAVIKGKSGAYFTIMGTGFSNGSPEYSGDYTLNGDIVYQGYTVNKSSKNELLKKYGVSPSQFRESYKEGIRIDEFWYTVK